MCAIIGMVAHVTNDQIAVAKINSILDYIWNSSHERGRDGRGYSLSEGPDFEVREHRSTSRGTQSDAPEVVLGKWSTMIGNLRAEPTTEFVLNKEASDQQPYLLDNWSIVHNGTIANDKELRTGRLPTTIDSAAIAEVLAQTRPSLVEFTNAVRKLQGSFAILATNLDKPHTMFVAANYRPIWYIVTPYGVFFASARQYMPPGYAPQMLQPYSTALFTAYGLQMSLPLLQHNTGNRALVVCSGGLDSVVSAAYAKNKLGMKIHLIHFMYGSRAEGPEVAAITAIAQYWDVPLTLFPLPIYSKGDSPLLDPGSKVAGGEEGAEFAHEWVPARNLVLLSVATAYAEAQGIEVIVLGNNLEEAGAYPDNEPEFIAKFNDLLPFAVGDGKRMQVIMPVGNMMKHEIVDLGEQVEAPMHLTWSCYRAGKLHCGKCGPCFMRRKAFEINELEEVIQYEDEQ